MGHQTEHIRTISYHEIGSDLFFIWIFHLIAYKIGEAMLILPSPRFLVLLLTEHKPQIDVRRYDSCKCKGNTDLEEIGIFNGVPFFAENTDARDVC